MASRPSQRFTTGTYHKRCKIGGWEIRGIRATTRLSGRKIQRSGMALFTLNECWTFVELGHATGVFAPGLKPRACGPGDPRAFARGHPNRARGERQRLCSRRRNPRAHRGSRAHDPRRQWALPDRDDGRSLPRVLLGVGLRAEQPKTVDRMLEFSVKPPVKPNLGLFIGIIDAILAADQRPPEEAAAHIEADF
jgi:hypothetical protein